MGINSGAVNENYDAMDSALLLVIFFEAGMFCAGRQLGRDSRNGDGFNGALIPVSRYCEDVDKETTITYVTTARILRYRSIPEDHYLITFTKEGLSPMCAVRSHLSSQP